MQTPAGFAILARKRQRVSRQPRAKDDTMAGLTKITDEEETVGWFFPEEATCIDENTYFDGSNHISKATGRQTEHQRLYYTGSGNWILNSWSQFQGSIEAHRLISDADAVRWLISIEASEEDIKELPEDVKRGVLQEFEKYRY